jgi:hypothetical protein
MESEGHAGNLSFNTSAAKAFLGKRIKENDLTVVEGIGPQTKELFDNHDIMNHPKSRFHRKGLLNGTKICRLTDCH